MKLRVCLDSLLFLSLTAPATFLAGCDDTPSYPVHIRSNFADAALQVVNLIERAHNHDLNFGKDELPQDAVARLRTYAHGFDENFIVDNVNGLSIIVDAHAENEYYQCDAEINQVLRSRLMPEIPFPGCR